MFLTYYSIYGISLFVYVDALLLLYWICLHLACVKGNKKNKLAAALYFM